MGKGRKGTGVELRETAIRVSFTLNGERCRETLAIAPTEPNRRYAERLVAAINREIAAGTFTYARHFPDSPRATVGAAASLSVRQAGEKWLRGKGRLASATRSQYENALEFWYSQIGGARSVAEIEHGDLAALIGDYDWPSAKLTNNYLITLRGLFALAVRDKTRADDPMEGIENSALQAPIPDPFARDEAEEILADLFKHYPEGVGNYYEAAFYGGFRPEEEIALMHGDIDWALELARVQRARSFRGELKPVKGYAARDVELLGRALEALRRQRKLTLLKPHGFIYENHVTDRPWHDERSQRDHYWKPALTRLGLRYRTPYHTRHTFATMMLMNGANVTWVAKQMGNSPRVIYKHYAKWIEQADRSRERNKIEAALAQFVPNLSPQQKNAGRRDWTRTNTPGKPTGTDGNDSE